MLPLYTTVAILLVIGILSILEFDIHAFWQYLMHRGDRLSLKDDVTILAGDIPKGFFKRQNYETAMILKSTGRENSFQVVRVISMIAAVVGIVVAMLLRIPYGRLMDLCAPSECVMLTIMKLQCLADGCCGGRTICLANGAEFVFPSQIVELIDAFAIAVILICMSRKEKHRDKLYPWYMVIYGATRFVLNLFRGGTTPFALGLPAGNVWSLVAIIIGTVWLLAVSRRKTKQENC